jgi:gamma-glutamylputrescine oxidase
MTQAVKPSLTWYDTTADRAAVYPPLMSEINCDACVIGGGLAGLTTALELARAGQKTVLLEAEHIAWSASGRNGGFVSAGFAEGAQSIFAHAGRDGARALHKLSVRGADYVRRHVEGSAIMMGEGVIVAQRHPDHDGLKAYRDFMAREHGQMLDLLSVEETRALLATSRYFESLRNDAGFHIHPLAYALKLASDAALAGASIHEGSRALSVEKQGAVFRIRTDRGEVRARHVVHCVSSLDRRLHPPSARAVLPVATYIAVTAPIAQDAIRTTSAIADTRRAGNYYRRIDGRILWGGRITTQIREPARLAEQMRGDMVATYPQLAAARMEFAWAGLMGYALHKMPLIGRDEQGQWYATAFGGHGLNTTAMAGLLIANAIAHGDDEYRRFDAYGPRWAGGPLGRVGVQGSYWWMQIRDRFAERHAMNRA